LINHFRMTAFILLCEESAPDNDIDRTYNFEYILLRERRLDKDLLV
jgi:hypothetical protein